MRRTTPVLLTLAVAVGGAACCGRAEAPSPAEPAEVVRDPAPRTIPLDDRAIAALRAADHCFLGRIVEVGPSPGVWSGIVATFQPVVVELERRLDGSARTWPRAGDRFPVWFGVVGPPDCLREEPRLDPRIYRAGARGVFGARVGVPVTTDGPYAHPTGVRAVTSFHEVVDDRDLARITSGR